MLPVYFRVLMNAFIYSCIGDIDNVSLRECLSILDPTIIEDFFSLINETRRLIEAIDEGNPDDTHAIVTNNRFAAKMVVRVFEKLEMKTHVLRMSDTREYNAVYTREPCPGDHSCCCDCDYCPSIGRETVTKSYDYCRDDTRSIIFVSITGSYWERTSNRDDPIQEVLVRGTKHSSKINLIIGDEQVISAHRGCNVRKLRTFRCNRLEFIGSLHRSYCELFSTPPDYLEQIVVKHQSMLRVLPETDENRRAIDVLDSMLDFIENGLTKPSIRISASEDV